MRQEARRRFKVGDRVRLSRTGREARKWKDPDRLATVGAVGTVNHPFTVYVKRDGNRALEDFNSEWWEHVAVVQPEELADPDPDQFYDAGTLMAIGNPGPGDV